VKLLIDKGMLEDMFVLENDVAAHYPTYGEGDSDSDSDFDGCEATPAVD
jgi:hypothetical protein